MDPPNILGNLSNGSIYPPHSEVPGKGHLLPLPLNLIGLIISYVRRIHELRSHSIGELTC